MAIFEEIRYTWGGKDYTLPPGRVLRAIAAVEEVLTMAELHRYMQAGKPPLAKLAMAYGAVLRQAGAIVSDDEIYAGMFAGGEMKERVGTAIGALLAMMIPPESLRQAEKGEAPPKN
jgi:hypothetical protein